MSKNERFRVKTFTNPSGTKVFRVSGRLPDGKQIRRNFPTPREAGAFKAQLELSIYEQSGNYQLRRTRLDETQLAEAEAAFLRLGVSGPPLSQIVDYFLRNYQPINQTKTVTAAYREFLADKQAQRLRPRSLQDLRSRVGRLAKAYGSRSVSEITTADIKLLVVRAGQAARTRNSDRRAYHGFFEWCLKHELCTTNPVAKIDVARVDETEPQILTLSEVRQLLRAAQEYKAGIMVPYFALSLFAGLRPAELERISWSNIDLAGHLLTVDGNAAKLRKRRLVELSDNLVSWLMPHVGQAIVGINHRRDFDAVRRSIGFQGRVTEADPGLKVWPDDVLRHTALSNHLASHQHEGKTAHWAGNSPDILQRHYKGLVRATDAAEFWKLSPESLASALVALPAA